ncbi:ketoacyl-ACP synthase III [Streptomyces angustmyceticus]|uniref:3-oxoacyl-ACP synthase III family protein n=1 Tax=Streptomyces angustmyceticus TaxID=285578 RepID=UPI001302AB18|nr:ketoacyl-ACP synthase III [Streptomyces angustmyceticus]UAL66018.1 ketoacyl-ACP synthase III [Streptomyces angustmyceticus]
MGLALPDRVVSNAELCETLDTTPEWIEEKTGILERRFLGADETITELAIQAGEKAVHHAGIEARDIDVLVVASSTPEWIMPSLGVIVAERLGIETPRIVDMTQHACASAVYAIHTASCLLQEPGLQNALVVCAEGASRVSDPRDRTVRIFFGDAAGATVLTRTEGSGGLLSYDLGNAYSPAVALAGPSQLNHARDTPGHEGPSPYLQMDGRVVWQEATTRLPKSVSEALAAAGVEASEVNGFAFHQANVRLLQYIVRTMGVDYEKVPITADVLGNTGAASPMTALWRLAADGRAKAGDVIVLGAIGAGFLWGSLCFQLPNDVKAEE